MRYQVIALDWDGTLVNSLDHIVASMRSAFAAVQRDYPGDIAVRECIGLGMQDVLTRLLGEPEPQDLDPLFQAYRDAFMARPSRSEDIFPGVMKTLNHLRNSGYQLSVVTGKSRAGLDRALDELGLAGYFASLHCADQVAPKPRPDMLLELMKTLDVPASSILMVGDTTFDLEMAHRAGVASIGVAYGAHSVEDLVKWPALALLERFEHLLDHV